MADYQYFILLSSDSLYSTFKSGRICYTYSSHTLKYTPLSQSRTLKVLFIGSHSAIDYPVDIDRLQPISREEAGLLLALPEEDRLKFLKERQALETALRLEVGHDVWVQEGPQNLRGTICYIGNMTKPTKCRELEGVYYGIELKGLDRGKGHCDGSFQNKRCFSCEKNCGVFAPFSRVTAVEHLTSPQPDPRPRLEQKPASKQNLQVDQPMSLFEPDHFKDPKSNRDQRESRSEEAKSGWDIRPKPESKEARPGSGPGSPDELMEQEHLYEEVEPRSEPKFPLTRFRSKSAKGVLGSGSEESKTNLRFHPKRFELRPGSAKRGPKSEESKTEQRPQSQSEENKPRCLEPGPKPKSWSPDPKPRQNKPKSPTGPGPEAKPRSGLGPADGPRPGSTDGLEPGDRVLFFDEKEQPQKGTVLFMEKNGPDIVVYITGESGSHCVLPLQCIMKLDHEPAASVSDLEDMYMDPDDPRSPKDRPLDQLGPDQTQDRSGPDQTQDRSRPDHSSLGLESVVEITVANGEKAFGTIRWMGYLAGTTETMVGLELEEKKGVSDGTFRDKRFFWCPDKHALFVKLTSCRPDSRFLRDSSNHNAPVINTRANHIGLANHQNHNADDSVPEPVPPISTEQVSHLLIGRMKGIQGHHNSCYMDSALFSLFCCSSVLDSLLFKSTQPQDAAIQRTLLRDIVNPLRRNGFVEGCHVMNLRQQLKKHGFSQTFTTDEKDPEEFLTVIMHHILALDPLLKLSSGGKVQDSYCYQIFLDQSHSLVLPTVQQLLEQSFYSNSLKLAEVPSCLILQMPRFGKKFKMFDKIIPSLELDVTELLAHGPKQCILCAREAHVECLECFLDPAFGQTGFKLFCDQCSAQVHAHPCRCGHHPSPLDIRYRGYQSRPSFSGNREKLQLLAVLCIETSHYVSFVKYGPRPDQWLFYDSMADREGEADGYNVPEVLLAPEVSQYLNMSLSELANQKPRDMTGVAKRLLCDAYLYLYHSPALSLYT